MQGTIVCGVTDTDEGRQALATAVELAERLRLRLVLAHIAEGIGSLNGDADGGESVTMKVTAKEQRAYSLGSRTSTRWQTAPSGAWPSATPPRSWDGSPPRRPPT
jgi:hypothetical protein